jgi:hypothetical protein
MFAIRDRR